MEFFTKFLFFCCGFVSIYCFNFRFGKGGRQAYFDKFNNTCGDRKVILVFDYSGMRVEENKLWFNCSFTAKEDILKDPTLKVFIERCKNQENLDTCEPFNVYQVPSYCGQLDLFSPMSHTFFSKFDPKYKCPIRKGAYKATDAMLDTTTFLMFPVDGWYWKVRAEIHDRDTDKRLMCLIVEAHVN